MKSEAEIRAYLANLRRAMDAPCQCRGTRHRSACEAGAAGMAAAHLALSWALGDAPHHQRYVNEIARAFGAGAAGGG